MDPLPLPIALLRPRKALSQFIEWRTPPPPTPHPIPGFSSRATSKRPTASATSSMSPDGNVCLVGESVMPICLQTGAASALQLPCFTASHQVFLETVKLGGRSPMVMWEM